MKKILLCLLAIAFIVCSASCGDKNANITCFSCGEELTNVTKFCPNCGSSLDVSFDVNENNEENNENKGNNNAEKILVGTAKELLNSIKSNSNLSLTASSFNFNNPVIINEVENLTIDGSVSFVFDVDSFYMGGLQFENCENILFKNVKFTSLPENNTTLFTAMSFSDCSNIRFENCSFEDLSSSISLSRTNNFDFKNCSFSNIEYTSIYLWYSKDVTVDSCSFRNAGNTFNSTASNVIVKDSIFENINGSTIFCDELYDYTTDSLTSESEVSFEKCTFKNNGVLDFFNKATQNGDYNYTYEYNHDKIKFKHCSFTSNIYVNGDLNTSNYIDCSFNNNSIGIEIPDITYWCYDENTISRLNEDLKGINYSIEYNYDADISSNLVTSTLTIVSQSKVGVVSKNDSGMVITIAKPAITLEYIDWNINSAGGVEPDVKFTNNTDKQIAYVYFTVKYYDRMGTPAYCSIKRICEQRLKVTGPINAGITKTIGWEPTIYNSAVGAIKPLSIEIIFTDGTNQVITNTGGYWYSDSYYGGELKD